MKKNKKKQPIPATTDSNGRSARYRFFCWAMAFLALAQLVVGLDYVTIWPGAELHTIWASMHATESLGYLPLAILSTIPEQSEYWLLAYRLPSLLLYLLGVFLFFRWGRSLFGEINTEVTLLLVGASILFPFLVKTAALDGWRLGLELAFWLALLRFFKTPEKAWFWSATVLGFLVVLVGGHSAWALVLAWNGGYFWLLRRRKSAVWKQVGRPFIGAYVGIAAAIALKGMLGYPLGWKPFAYFSIDNWSHLRMLGYSFLSLAPFVGFLLAGLRDVAYKFRRGEELAGLLVVGLIGA
ncbi:MAG: hypothetical protein AAGJ82_11145, partial [Bacteroidota bacterium]